MKKYVFLVEYKGGGFAGFQVQPVHTTIQSELERVLKIILREDVRIFCCGRTDSGVHATGQVVHFESTVVIDDSLSMLRSMNALLPISISIRQISQVGSDFHARFSCIAREYEYLIWNDKSRNAIFADSLFWCRKKLDVDVLHNEIQKILGENDFTSFTRPLEEGAPSMRYVDLASVERVYDPISDTKNIIKIRIRANAFLHNMIRILVGSLLDIHDGKLKRGMSEIIKCKDRVLAGKTVSPIGLYFRKAYYLPVWNDVEWLDTLESYPWMKVNQVEKKN